jgi:hypothetical protein
MRASPGKILVEMPLVAQLDRIPDVTLPAVDVRDSVAYLASPQARASIAADTYWPKWDSPWWHMVLLWELGEARQIPAQIVRAMVDGLNALPLKTFPIWPEDAPPGHDGARDSSCHCAMGSITQVLHACGVDVTRELPWGKPWFQRYQMADGGLNCDEAAYRAEGECPSSMVGTAAAFEAMQLIAEDDPFLEKAARFMVTRALVNGSETTFNAAERESASTWAALCFPRFYFYDVLRGLAAIVAYTAAHADRRLAACIVEPIVTQLAAKFPDGIVRVERQAFAGRGSLVCRDGAWQRVKTATMFPLLERTSAIGAPSAALTRQWRETRARLRELVTRGQLAEA